ncbi:MJ1255/VC2487 family glycosyltransferase [Marinomonas atlantica]|uniref:MJ1255/VC2487 family glycosyltransferase n=1 Tax=Marinomonas atlantica TaxID=1806668 RepID=UPI000834CC84|nr:MJ1255/VC2487 family glycosyltransferase [Marinomonas atlantica]
MKILYGVQGTGNGHITRARAMSVEFDRLGIEVDYVFSGRDKHDYFDMQCFGEFRSFSGLSFAAKDGKVNLLATYRKAQLIQLFRDISALDLSSYDLILTDFEPITAWAAKRQSKPCIGVGHQYAFQHDIPKHKGDVFGAWVMSNFAPVTQGVGVHWHHFDKPILPPIIQHTGQYTTNIAVDDQVLVYLPFENSEEVMECLENVTSHRFRMHCKDIEPGVYGNIEVFPFSRDEFQKNLRECESVLCNAGFELNSEALHLGRRILVKPLQGQIEQLSNVVALERLGLASSTNTLSSDVVSDWLNNAKVVRVCYPNVARGIAEWVSAGAKVPIEELSTDMWQQVSPSNGVYFCKDDIMTAAI